MLPSSSLGLGNGFGARAYGLQPHRLRGVAGAVVSGGLTCGRYEEEVAGATDRVGSGRTTGGRGR